MAAEHGQTSGDEMVDDATNTISDRVTKYIEQAGSGLAMASPFGLLAIPVACQAGWWIHYKIPFGLFDMSFFTAALWMTLYAIIVFIYYLNSNFYLKWVSEAQTNKMLSSLYVCALLIMCFMFSFITSLAISGWAENDAITGIIFIAGLVGLFIMVLYVKTKAHIDSGIKFWSALSKTMRGVTVKHERQDTVDIKVNIEDNLFVYMFMIVGALSTGAIAGRVNDHINNNDGQKNLVVASVGGLIIRSGNGVLSIKPNSEPDSY